MNTIEKLKTLLAKGHENALLRFSLGSAYLKEKNYLQAIEHLSRAVELDPGYSAAWKLYGKALSGDGRIGESAAAYERGIAVAEKKGDIQAAKEMKVFLKRLIK
jgi:Tfp pilus assembly protein PilF